MENFRIADRVKDPSLHLKKKPETHETFWICKATYGLFLINFFFKIFRQKRREEERERNINVWFPIVRPPTRDLAHNPGTCPDWESNQQLFGL